MRVHARLVLLVAALTVTLVLVPLVVRSRSQAESQRLLAQHQIDLERVLGRLIHLYGQPLAFMAQDYTFWDEMVAFVSNPDPQWAQESLVGATESFDIQGVWIYDPSFRLVYRVPSELGEALPMGPLAIDQLRNRFRSEKLPHFFVQTEDALLEVRAASIHPSSDPERATAAQGYFVAARVWDEDRVAAVGELAQGTARLTPPNSASAEPVAPGVQRFSFPLTGPDGAPVAELEVNLDSPLGPHFERSVRRETLWTLGLSAVALGTLALVFLLWLGIPLRRLSLALSGEDPKAVEALVNARDEFGNLARLIRDDLKTRRQLAEAFEEISRAHEALLLTQFSVDNAAEAIYWLLPDGSITYANDAAARMLGYSREEFLGLRASDLIIPESSSEVWHMRWEAISAAGSVTYESEHRHKDGHPVPVEVTASLLVHEGVTRVCAFVRDITFRKEYERALETSQRELAHLMRSLPTPVIVIDAETRLIIDTNRAAAELIGASPREIIGHECHRFICQTDRDSCPIDDLGQEIDHSERVLLTARGECVPILKSVVPVLRDGRKVFVESFVDIRAQKQAEEVLRNLSTQDALTHLPNRRSFEDRLSEEWRRALRDSRHIGILLCDIDHFKAYNDTFGHLQGDQCLIRVGEILKETCRRAGDHVARWGGEEFAVIVPGADPASLLAIGELLRSAVEDAGLPAPGDTGRPVTISVGAASMVPSPSARPEDLFSVADEALYASKQGGRNHVTVRVPQDRTGEQQRPPTAAFPPSPDEG